MYLAASETDRGIDLFRHDPDGEHDDDDGDELQQHAKPHEFLRCIARAPAHHIDEAKEKHHGHGADGDRDSNVRHEIGHDGRPSLTTITIAKKVEYWPNAFFLR